MKKLAKAGNMSQAKILAKSVAKARKHTERMTMQKAQLQGIEMQIGAMGAMARVSGAFEKSTEIMKLMGKLIKAPELSATMREMQAEMAKMSC